MGMEASSAGLKIQPRAKYPCRCALTKLLPFLLILFTLLIICHFTASPFTNPSSPSWPFPNLYNPTYSSQSKLVESLTAKLKDSITFLPLKDLRYSNSPMEGNTWFMSSLNSTIEENEPKYLYFPSNSSKGRVLCFKGSHSSDGTKNSYALAWPEALPPSATLLEGLTFVSNTYWNHDNILHGLNAIAPFVSWSMKNQCMKPSRWVLLHWGEVEPKMGSWVRNLAKALFGDVGVEIFGKGDGPYCFEKAVVMRHDLEGIGAQKKLKVFELLRCKAREACGVDPMEMKERGVPTIRMTLLLRRGARSFKNEEVVKSLFRKECERVEGCVLSVIQSDGLSFCDQVRAMTNTDILVSPHGAQQTNMLFMERGSSVMEFFPKGWLEHAGIGQYIYHWMATDTGMKHQGAWRDSVGEECPNPKQELECFFFHKDKKIGRNETYFAEWARKVLNEVRITKLEQASKKYVRLSGCEC
ncbi:hypothetical protein Vadar_020898 [Vaccinium darrowii]|uniref:Uncharacterized protein n=1 Tax=Vaccinium darrowii TaxID=229202 RepID=A0ACB7X2W4_9ERIC|nr:hypothetical protein Vadar_020898 [Vaccinium darrowii]